MEIARVVAIGLVGVVLSLMLKKHNAEIALAVAIATGILILMFVCGYLGDIFSLLRETAEKAGVGSGYFGIVLKVTGIAYLAQFGMELCLDAGAQSIASKIELAGKILIMALSAPVLLSLLEVVMGIG